MDGQDLLLWLSQSGLLSKGARQLGTHFPETAGELRLYPYRHDQTVHKGGFMILNSMQGSFLK